MGTVFQPVHGGSGDDAGADGILDDHHKSESGVPLGSFMSTNDPLGSFMTKIASMAKGRSQPVRSA